MIRGFDKALRAYESKLPSDDEQILFCPNCKNFLSEEDRIPDTDTFSCKECGKEFDVGDAMTQNDINLEEAEFRAERMEEERRS